MKKLNHLWVRYGTPRNLKILYISIVLASLAAAGGAPSNGGGSPGILGLFADLF
jgi:hypothetical protein